MLDREYVSDNKYVTPSKKEVVFTDTGSLVTVCIQRVIILHCPLVAELLEHHARYGRSTEGRTRTGGVGEV